MKTSNYLKIVNVYYIFHHFITDAMDSGDDDDDKCHLTLKHSQG